MFDARISRVLARFLVVLGVGFLVCAAATFYSVAKRNRIPGQAPVTRPIDLGRTGRDTVSFAALHSKPYYVEIDLRRNVPAETLEMLREQLEQAVHCRIESEGSPVPVDRRGGGSSGETVSATVARFDAASGRRYTVVLEVRRPDAAYAPLDPRLHVRLTRIVAHEAMMDGLYRGTGVLISGVLSLPCFLYAAFLWRSRGKEEDPQ